MSVKTQALVSGVFLVLLTVGTVAAASFDCDKATSEAEKLICSDDEMSKLDESLGKAYLKALKRTLFKKQMSESQKQWLKNKRNVCSHAECIKKAYEARIKELKFISSYVTVYSWNRDPMVNLAAFQPLSEPFKAILAMYAAQAGGDCTNEPLECTLTSSLGLGPQCSDAQINLVRKWFREGMPPMAEYQGPPYILDEPEALEGICYRQPQTATVQQVWDTIRIGIRGDLVFVEATFSWTHGADGPSGHTGYSTVYGIANDRIITVSHKKVLDKEYNHG
jgi:uncharacterized protein